jgi:hypothetical protein
MDGIAKDDLWKSPHYRALLDAYHNHPAIEPVLFRFLLNFDSCQGFNDSDGATVVATLIGALLRHKDTPKRLRRKIAKEMRRLHWKADSFNTADPEHVEEGGNAIDHANRKRRRERSTDQPHATAPPRTLADAAMPEVADTSEQGEDAPADSETNQAEAPLTDAEIKQITEATAFLMSQPLPARMRQLLDDALLECANDVGIVASDPDIMRGWVPKFLRAQTEANN